MGNSPLFVRLFRKNTLLVLIAMGLATSIGLSGCDYWPPALHSQIEELRADLNDALDERQRLDIENSELRKLQASMQQEVEDKSHENDELRSRLAAQTKEKEQLARAERKSRAVTSSSKTTLTKSAYTYLQLKRPLMRGSRVTRIQRQLKHHDLPVRVDGIYGRDTASAIRGFQRYHGIAVDGIVGPATERALGRNANSSKLARQLSVKYPPLKGRDVVQVQRALRRAGHRIAVDGEFGPKTGIAVTRFQRKRGLHPDGVVGPKTWVVLKARG